jgi:hypothetical protein
VDDTTGAENRSLADPVAREELSIKFDADTGQFEVLLEVKDTDLTDPDAGPITTSLTIGGRTFMGT